MYGTVMIGQLAPGTSPTEFIEKLQAYSNRDRSDGFVDANILVTDDGTQVVIATRFATREQYWALADTTDQDDWYRSTLAPMLDGDPTWIDGTWSD
jgi:heme-degrading monooxygenase HmoA